MYLILSFVAVCLVFLIILQYQSLVFAFYAVKFEIEYFYLGLKGIAEDHICRRYVSRIKGFPSRPGDVAVITGGGRGIGLHAAIKLMSSGMHVVLGCRNVQQGNEAIEKLRASGMSRGSAVCLHVDMASFSSVRQFAKQVLGMCPKINILMNNAGIMFVPFELTEDGVESHLAVNYLGHCLLTHLLLPRLRSSAAKGAGSRIVNVSSIAHERATINFQDLNMKTWYLSNVAYGQSKLAQLLFTRALERKLRAAQVPIQVHAVHPGVVNTELFDNTAFKLFVPWLLRLLFKTPEEGAMPLVFAAVAEELEGAGGTYISNCRVTQCSEEAARESTQEMLWTRMMELLQLQEYGGL